MKGGSYPVPFALTCSHTFSFPHFPKTDSFKGATQGSLFAIRNEAKAVPARVVATYGTGDLIYFNSASVIIRATELVDASKTPTRFRVELDLPVLSRTTKQQSKGNDMGTQEITSKIGGSPQPTSSYQSQKLVNGRINHRQNQPHSHNGNGEKLAQALGWFSVGLGVGEVLAPKQVSKVAGFGDGDGHPILLRAFGLREIASGVGMLSRRRPTVWAWSRVAGDVIDLTCLATGLSSPKAKRGKVLAALATIAGVTVVDVLCAKRLSKSTGKITSSGAIRVKKSIIINRPVEEVYRFWRDLQNLPRFMNHLESVDLMDETRSRWTAKGPAGKDIQWYAIITDDKPNEKIGWQSVENSDIKNSGTVLFKNAPGNRGTIIRVEVEYFAPGGLLGDAIAMLFGEEPSQQIEDDLRRFKQVIETGDVVLSDSTLFGTGLSEQRSAQPYREEFNG
jgi:uncharacterized membrane protein